MTYGIDALRGVGGLLISQMDARDGTNGAPPLSSNCHIDGLKAADMGIWHHWMIIGYGHGFCSAGKTGDVPELARTE